MERTIVSRVQMLLSIASMLIVLGAISSCTKTKDNNVGPGPNEVWIQGMAFEPVSLTITAGTTVTWTNRDAVSHTVTSNTGLFDSGVIPKDGTYTHTFASAGTYPYHCTIHPTMTATIVVQ